MATRKSHPLDAMVGARIRMLRVNRGISQAMLAGRIGVTFQQVQKYERGADRIGASRLSRIASVLGVSVGELFESSGAESPGLNSLVRLLAEPDALRVLKAYACTTDPRVRLSIAKLVQSIADRAPAAKATVARLDAFDRDKRRGFGGEDSLPQEDEQQSHAAPVCPR
ncbi:helix-turn-helix domain-containing protein [Bradyrhizobium sp. CSA112]|uniref:helix-turn-helix domain-containing protein n=1 Tax=Bradyrhizobium sp. CSA112 TaxID=2699170 RepID=UPI0023B0EA28|nr:helix-turn-helix transcriptional regulator [Bradyrhizobium sp. CSA112]MDE5453221.1 helix-turn-helix domain-containing protein [Bradyrhizobium sp. CSA112]